MPTLTIDGRSVTVPEGRTILEAARSIGIDVPTLCWYPKLPIVGNILNKLGVTSRREAAAVAARDGLV